MKSKVSVCVCTVMVVAMVIFMRPATAWAEEEKQAPQATTASNSIARSVFGDAATSGQSKSDLSAPLSCPVFEGDGILLGEDRCLWTKATGQRTTQNGLTTDSPGVAIGGQMEIAAGWFVGGALHAGWSSMQSSGISNTGQDFSGSLALKRVAGPWLLAGALTIGTSTSHIARPALVGGTMQSDSSNITGGLRLRGAYDFTFSGAYLRPRLDLDAYYVNQPGFQEYGPDSIGVTVNSYQKINTSIAPALELGGRVDMGIMILRPYVVGGVAFLPDNTRTVGIGLIGPAAPAGTFQVTVNAPNVLGTLESGLQLYQAHAWEVKADYTLAAGDSYLSQTLGLRGAYHF